MKRWIIGAGLLAVLTLAPARAAVSFDEGATTAGVVTADLSVEGYRFSASQGHAITRLSGYGASNGSNYLVMLFTGHSVERIAALDASSFELRSLDLGGWLNFGPNPRQLELTGYRAGDVQVRALLTVAPGSFQTFALSGFQDLLSLELRGTGNAGAYYVALDNLRVLSPVPEPQTALLLLSGLALLAARRSRYLRRLPALAVDRS